jgi:hypothetical protein
MLDMKTLRTLAIIVAVALAAIGLAVLPSVDEAPQARPGISVGETSSAEQGSAAAPGAEEADAETPSGESVPLPAPTAAEQPVRGIHAETGLGTMEPEASPEPAPAPAPKPAPEQPRASGSSSSGSSSGGSSSGGASSGAGKSTPPRPAGVCEWDDGELECDDDDDDGDDDDDDD